MQQDQSETSFGVAVEFLPPFFGKTRKVVWCSYPNSNSEIHPKFHPSCFYHQLYYPFLRLLFPHRLVMSFLFIGKVFRFILRSAFCKSSISLVPERIEMLANIFETGHSKMACKTITISLVKCRCHNHSINQRNNQSRVESCNQIPEMISFGMPGF